ncbi:MAG: TatD family hydrolase [Nitrososphaerales archaeon]
MTLVDAHIHLPAYSGREGEVRLAGTGSMLLVSCTVNPSEAAESLRMRSERPLNVRCFVGVHPSDVTGELSVSALAPFLDQCDGIGEIGLDEKYSPITEGSAQMGAFLYQLTAAEKLGKPVQVHSRGAEEKCMEILGTFNLKSVLMHWFEGEGLVSEIASRGYFVSLGPALLYSKKLRRIARALPAENILTESDGPVPYGPLGGASGPSLIASVIFGLAGIRGGTYEGLEKQVEENSKRFLGEERLI